MSEKKQKAIEAIADFLIDEWGLKLLLNEREASKALAGYPPLGKFPKEDKFWWLKGTEPTELPRLAMEWFDLRSKLKIETWMDKSEAIKHLQKLLS